MGIVYCNKCGAKMLRKTEVFKKLFMDKSKITTRLFFVDFPVVAYIYDQMHTNFCP